MSTKLKTTYFFFKLSHEKLLVFISSQAQFTVDLFAMVTGLLFQVNSQFINGRLTCTR